VIAPATAILQAEALEKAAIGCPVRQVRIDLERRAREWSTAVAILDQEDTDIFEIDLVGTLAAGDRILAEIPVPFSHDNEVELTTCPVVRVLHRDGGCTLHLVPFTGGKDVYLNMAGPASPVVVRR
jgi:hypothetical protein